MPVQAKLDLLEGRLQAGHECSGLDSGAACAAAGTNCSGAVAEAFNGSDGLPDSVELLSNVGLFLNPLVILAVGFGYFRKVPRAVRRNDVDLLGIDLRRFEVGGEGHPGALLHGGQNGAVEAVHARVVELRSNGTEHRHLVLGLVPEAVVALELLAHVAQRVEGPALVELVEGNNVGEIEHVDFLQLGGGPVLGRHHVEAGVGVLDDFGVTLPDAGSFEDDEVELGGPHHVHGVLHVLAQGQVALAGSQAAHVHPGAVDGVHPDPVAEQCPAGFALAWVDGDDGNGFLGEVEQEPPHQLIHEAGLARPARAGDTEDGGFSCRLLVVSCQAVLLVA